MFTNARADRSSSAETSAVEAIPTKPPGQSETIKKYMK
jgi:hypothetical protein